MTYTKVCARENGKGRIHGTIYFGIKDKNEAINKFLTEYPEFSKWDLWAEVFIGCYEN